MDLSREAWRRERTLPWRENFFFSPWITDYHQVGLQPADWERTRRWPDEQIVLAAVPVHTGRASISISKYTQVYLVTSREPTLETWPSQWPPRWPPWSPPPNRSSPSKCASSLAPQETAGRVRAHPLFTWSRSLSARLLQGAIKYQIVCRDAELGETALNVQATLRCTVCHNGIG